MKIIPKYKFWKDIVSFNEAGFNLWELVPQPLEVTLVESIPWVDSNIYHIEYKGIRFMLLKEEIEEIIFEENDSDDLDVCYKI